MPESKETVSLREIILELRDEEMSQDNRYAELIKLSWEEEQGEESKELEKLMNKYDDENYYRKNLRYYNNIFENNDFMNSKKQGYDIPIIEKEFVKLLLREYGSPFMKKLRSKRMSQLTFSEFDDFIKKIEEQVDISYKDEKEKKAFLTKLNLLTSYQERRRLFDLKKEVQEIVANDLLRLYDLSNGEIKNELVEGYYRNMKKLSQSWQKEIDIQVEIEEAIIEEMADEEFYAVDKAMNAISHQDHKDIHIPYNDYANEEELNEFIPSASKEDFEKKRKKWEKIIRLENEEEKK